MMHLLKKKVYTELGEKVIEDYYKRKYSIDTLLYELSKYPIPDDKGFSIQLEISLEEMELLSDEDKCNIAQAYLSLLSLDEVCDKEMVEEILVRKQRFIEYLEMIRFGASIEWVQQLAGEERIALEEDIKRFVMLNPENAELLKIEENHSEGKKYLELR